MNKQKIVKNLTKAFTFCLCCVFCVGVLFSTALTVYGADEPSESGGSAIITDLTGYTVTVPSGWTSTAGYGIFENINFSFDIPSYDFGQIEYGNNIYIGYNYEGNANNNVIVGAYRITSIHGFEITFIGGVDVTNSLLIQWLYDNNAIFVNNNEPSTKQFHIQQANQVLTCEFVDGMTLGEWAGSEYDLYGYAIASGYRLFNGEYVTIDIIVNSIETTGTCYSEYRALETLKGLIGSDYILKEDDLFLDTSGVTLYNECYATGYNQGYDDGYGRGEYLGHQTGYNEGFVAGKTEGQSSNIGENLIGSGFSAITGALNQIIVYQSSTGTVVTLWVIISGAVGIALFIWILKLFAGG